jgi:hypothetical protein
MPFEDPTQIGLPKSSGGSVSAFFNKTYSVLFSIFEFILRSIIAVLTSLAKVIRSVGIAVGIIFAALALLLLAIFFAADLPNSEKFQNFREESFATLSDWVELEFADIRERAAFGRGDEIVVEPMPFGENSENTMGGSEMGEFPATQDTAPTE